MMKGKPMPMGDHEGIPMKGKGGVMIMLMIGKESGPKSMKEIKGGKGAPVSLAPKKASKRSK